MGRADAMSVRADWPSHAMGTRNSGTFGDLTMAGRIRRARSKPGTTGHARLLAAPNYDRMVRSEAWMRRLVPLMIIVLLAVTIAARTVMLQLDGRGLEAAERASLVLSAELATERLLDRPGVEDIESDPALAADLLASLAMGATAKVPRTLLLATSTGRMIAAGDTNGRTALRDGIDRYESLASALPRILISLSDAQEGARVEAADGAAYVAAARRVTVLPSGATLVLLAMQDEAALYREWFRDIALEIIMMLAIGLSLIIVLFAYLRQNVRTRRSDQIYGDAQTRFHTALLRGRCGMWDWDLARGRMFWSPSMFEVLGYASHDEILPVARVSEWVHPDDLDLVSLGDEALQSGGTMLDRRFRMRTASGEWTWLRLRAELTLGDGNEPHLVGIAVDISEQEALERESERADRRLSDAVESISEAFVLWDSRRRLVMWNSKFQQFYALDGETLVRGARYDDVVAAGRDQLHSRKVNALRETEAGASTTEVQLDDGRWLQVNERRTKDGGVVSVQTDITQIKRNEEKLLHHERKLMASVSDLKETQLQLEINAQHLHELADMHREASEKAEAASRIKSEFMANVSHELRTPLNAILGFSETMTTQMFGPMGSDKYSEYAHDIHDSGQFLLNVINDVLDMSKIEAGRVQIDPEPLDVAAAVGESLRVVDLEASRKALTVHRTIPDSVEIEADRRAVKQILLNLLSNAVKFTPDGGEISVKVRQERGMVKLAIADSGCGIPRAALRRIGVPFEQAQNQFTKGHKGSGLGLAIARSLAELHGGSLDVRSVEGRGTFVLVRLPERRASMPRPGGPGPGGPGPQHPKRVERLEELAA